MPDIHSDRKAAELAYRNWLASLPVSDLIAAGHGDKTEKEWADEITGPRHEEKRWADEIISPKHEEKRWLDEIVRDKGASREKAWTDEVLKGDPA